MTKAGRSGLSLLFVHTDFPARYGQIAQHYATDARNTVVAICEKEKLDRRKLHRRINAYGYLLPAEARAVNSRTSVDVQRHEMAVWHGQAALLLLGTLREQGFSPDIACVHPDSGAAFFIRILYPDIPILVCADSYDSLTDTDDGDLTWVASPDMRCFLAAGNAVRAISFADATHLHTPSRFRQQRLPPAFRAAARILPEGVDTVLFCPDETAKLVLPPAENFFSGVYAPLPGWFPRREEVLTLSRSDVVVSFIAHTLEPHQGWDVFARAIPMIQKACPEAHILIAGGTEVSVGILPPPEGKNWRDIFLEELRLQADISRIHFLGPLFAEMLRDVLQVSRVVVHLTGDFALPELMLCAMSCGVPGVFSDTAAVQEVAQDGTHALLVAFRSPSAVAEATLRLVCEPSLANRLGQSARRQVVRQYDAGTVCLPRWQRTIDQLTGKRASAAGAKPPPYTVDPGDYDEWVWRFDTITDDGRQALHTKMAAMPSHPLISVVMPVRAPGLAWLAGAIASVQEQLYSCWELCIACDIASTHPAALSLLEEKAREDNRIRLFFEEENTHTSVVANGALALAAGEWVALLGHEDVLPEQALFHVAQAILENPQARLFYSDEDMLDEKGRRVKPYFKCDWNPDLFYSQNLFSCLGVYHRSLVGQVGGFRTDLDCLQDYDLVLRCAEQIPERGIVHIPRILYHRRQDGSSVFALTRAGPRAQASAVSVLDEHFRRMNVDARAELVSETFYRVRYALPAELPLVSLVIPTRNGLHLIRPCIESILQKTTYPRYEIIVVDNGSDDPAALRYLDSLHALPNVRVLRDERPFNYSALNNAAVTVANGALIGLINNDIEVISPDWLSEMVSHAVRPEIGAVGAKLYFPDGTVQHAGIILGLAGVAEHLHKGFSRSSTGYFGRAALISSFSAVTAACLLVRKSVYLSVGGLKQELAVCFNDVDFCLRLREAGYRNLFTPYAELIHHTSASITQLLDGEKQRARFATEAEYMHKCWGDALRHDPAWNPNLGLDAETFSGAQEEGALRFAFPPRMAETQGTR